MGFMKLDEFSVPKVILLMIVCLECLAPCASSLPRNEIMGILVRGGDGPHAAAGRGCRRDGHDASRATSRSRRSDLEVGQATNESSEAELLLEFRDGVAIDPFDFFSNWNSNNLSNYCSWSGVHCSSTPAGGRVTALNVSGFQLVGTISPWLGALQFLESLDLSHNLFRGPIPSSIANCSNLSVLDLSENSVDGTIPVELGGLSNLQELNLSWNGLTGALSPSFSNLSALRVLDLAHNGLQGDFVSIDWGGFGKLETLNLGSNVISGHVPESLSNCSSLVDLVLSENNFIGSIPDMFEGLQNLQRVSLDQNFLVGSIPPSLGAVQNLRSLSLSNNLLSGDIPRQLGNLRQLTHLYLYDNYLQGSVSDSLLNCSSLVELMVHSNQLSGELPSDIGVLSQLEVIYAWNNSFTGPIPLSLVECTSLIAVVLSFNFFSGEIPLTIGTKLSKLEFLYLDHNRFTGGIPASLSNISTLQEALLHSNQLIGAIPSELGRLKNLTNLDLSNNFFVGQIPPELGDLPQLLSLSLAENQLGGEIPHSIGQLGNLKGLNLSGNHLTGSIPTELSRCSQLSELDLSRNLLTGSIPFELRNLTALNRLYLNNNQFTGPISIALTQRYSNDLIEISLAHNGFSGVIARYDFTSLRHLQLSLDLSHNTFSGALPSGIGALEVVQRINFSFNSFSGPIPDAFSRCTGLQLLDLSFNNLDGQIPQSLTSLEHLASFNVSFNQLTGSVPDSGPFANFNDASFLGNPDLCGSALPNKCSSSCSGIGCRRLWVVIIPAVAAGVAAVLALAAVLFLFLSKTSDSRGTIAPALPNASHFTREIEGLSVGDIVAATNGFSDGSIIGLGSKSTVFSGVLPSGVMVAVKRLELRNDDRATAQLYRALQRLSKVEHPNLLKVHGMFSTGALNLLVLEYMPNGSLQKQLYDRGSCGLTWAQRLNIAAGVAEGMVHLHSVRAKPIIHLDLKPSNILLTGDDADMEPKVADYGIASYVNNESHVDTTMSTNLYGTIGYIPPEYGALTSVSPMGDVYNFGVMLMELVTRKQPTDDMFGQEVSLCSWVVDAFPSRVSEILDSSLQQELEQSGKDASVHLTVRLAIACTRNAPKERPTMVEARDMLNEIRSMEKHLASITRVVS